MSWVDEQTTSPLHNVMGDSHARGGAVFARSDGDADRAHPARRGSPRTEAPDDGMLSGSSSPGAQPAQLSPHEDHGHVGAEEAAPVTLPLHVTTSPSLDEALAEGADSGDQLSSSNSSFDVVRCGPVTVVSIVV